MTPKVLIVEDDSQIAKALQMNLSLSGYTAVTTETVAAAWNQISTEIFDILLLDVNLPDGTGLDLCHAVRASGSEVPILFLSAKIDEETVVQAMHIGADDYVRKPFGVEELKARMARALRKKGPPRDLQTFGPLKLDIGRRQAVLLNQPLSLSRREFDILTVLVSKAGDVTTRESIITYLDENSEIYDRTIDSHVSHLRRKLRDIDPEAIQILPIYGVGYQLIWKG